MRVSRSTKATALLLLVSLQYSFAALDVALCSSALCYPRVSGGRVGKVTKKCPEGFNLENDSCVKRTPKPCTKRTSTSCMAQPAGGCPADYTSTGDCGQGLDIAVNKTGRRLLDGGNPLVKEVNILGQAIVPTVILPKPAVSINIAKPKAKDPPKMIVNGQHQFPQIILPEPKIQFTIPKAPKVGPEIRFEGHPSILPNIIPVLPEPAVTIEVPKAGHAGVVPNIKTELNTKRVTVDLSQLGPKHTLDVNLPALHEVFHEVAKSPDVEINIGNNGTDKGFPKVIDLSALGPKKIYNITLPEVKIPKQGSITFVNNNANTPQYLDLTKVVPKSKTAVNIKLPEVNTNGAVLNVLLEDDKHFKDKDVIVVPGHKEKHNTVINVPGPSKGLPEKRSKLVVDVATNPKIHEAIEKLHAKKTQVEKINIQMPAIDLTKSMPEGHDVVVEVKPFLKFANATKDMPAVDGYEKRINVEMKNITIPRLMEDKTVLVKTPHLGDIAKHLLPKHVFEAIKAENGTNSTTTTTTTIINMPEKTLPAIPVPKDKIEANLTLPIKLPLVHTNGTGPAATVNIGYKEEWVGGNPILPNPGAKVAKAVEKAAGLFGAHHKCQAQCCKQVEEDVCEGDDVQTVAPELACEEGFTLDAKNGACLSGDIKVATCPEGMNKCSIAGKGVCVPTVDGKAGHDACTVFKALCHKGTILAKSCQA